MCRDAVRSYVVRRPLRQLFQGVGSQEPTPFALLRKNRPKGLHGPLRAAAGNRGAAATFLSAISRNLAAAGLPPSGFDVIAIEIDAAAGRSLIGRSTTPRGASCAL